MPSPGACSPRPRAVYRPLLMLRLVLGETRRIAFRGRTAGLVAVVGAYGVAAAGVETEAVARGALAQPSAALASSIGLQVLWLCAMGLPVVAGAPLARDLRGGYLRLQLSRGVTRTQLLAARLLAGAVVSLGVMSACALIVCIGAWLLVRPHAAPVGSAVAFAPETMGRSPLMWVALVVAVYAMAASALLATSSVAGLYASPLVAALAPSLAVLVLGFLFVGELWPLNPLERISFLQIHGARWSEPLSMFAYWSFVLAAQAAFGVAAIARRQV